MTPDAEGAPAALVEAVAGLCGLTWVLEACGTVGAFSLTATVIACAAVGTAVAVGVRRRWSPPEPVAPATSEPRLENGRRGSLTLAGLGAGLVACGWGASIAPAVNGGLTDPDSLWYHLPLAARFVQRGDIVSLSFFGPDAQTSYYPATTEMLHGFSMLLFGGDGVVALVNLGWLAVALLAAWCLGRPHGRGGACVVALAAVSTPLLLRTQAGGAGSDIAALGLLLAALALLAPQSSGATTTPTSSAGREWADRSLILAALAGGLAISAKITVALPVCLLAAGSVLVARRGRRLAAALTWAAGLLAAGGFWFARNLIAVHNPLPWLRLGPLPGVPLLHHGQSFTVAHYLAHGGGSAYFASGLEHELGPLWPGLLGLALIGALLGVAARSRGATQLVGVAALACALGYLVTPKSAGGLPGAPVLFATNLRFAAPALLMGGVLLALRLPLPPRRWTRWLAALGGLGVAAAALDYGAIGDHPVGAGLGVVAVGSCLLAVGLTRRAARWPRAVGSPVGRGLTALPAIALLLGLIAPVGLAVAALERHSRYSDRSNNIRIAYAWAAPLRHARLALAGSFAQYPFYGAALSNRVQWIGSRGPKRGEFLPSPSCAAFRAQLAAGGYGYVAITDVPRDRPAGFKIPERAWTRSIPGARLILHAGVTVAQVYALPAVVTAAGCERLAPGRPGGFVGL